MRNEATIATWCRICLYPEHESFRRQSRDPRRSLTVPLLILPVLIIVAIVALVPISLVQRYRMGTARQRARGWLTTLNLVGLSLSAIVFLVSAAFATIWIPHAFTYSLGGFVAGCLLGLVGLGLTRWEPARDALHYTPNRLLVLAITLLVTTRILYGIWRSIHAWRAGMDDVYWMGVSGIAGSMAAGAVVLGYYFAYWIGVRRRFRRHLTSSR